MHSLTKYIGGHGTSLGGAIIDNGSFDWTKGDRFPGLAKPDPSYHGIVWTDALGPSAYVGRARTVLLRNTGAALSPFNAFLLLQGLETLPLRMERHFQNAQAVAEHLANHPQVSWVNYPGLSNDPYHEVASRTLRGGYGALVTFGIEGGREAGRAFIEGLAMFSHLANIGDAKSLAIHPATTTHSQLNEEELEPGRRHAGHGAPRGRHRAHRRHPRRHRPGAGEGASACHRLTRSMSATSSGASSLGLVETRTVTLFDERNPLVLASGATLAPVEVAYETYGTLNADRSNAVYVCHALTGDAHAAGSHGDGGRPGWWDTMIGPGKPIDTDKLFVISSNLLGGCNGTTGPSSLDPAHRRAVRAALPRDRHARPRDGASCALPPSRRRAPALRDRRLARRHAGAAVDARCARRARAAVLACSTSRLSAQNIAFSEVARQSIVRDPDFRGGDYYEAGRGPRNGLSVARMTGHITYLSEESMEQRFDGGFSTAARIRTAASTSTSRSRATCTTRATASPRASTRTRTCTTRACSTSSTRSPTSTRPCPSSPAAATRFLLLSFSSDWRFGTRHSERIARVLERNGVPVTMHEVTSPYGHDSFLLDVPGVPRARAGLRRRPRPYRCVGPSNPMWIRFFASAPE